MRDETLKCRVIAQPSGLSKNKPSLRDLLIWAIERILSKIWEKCKWEIIPGSDRNEFFLLIHFLYPKTF